MIDSEKNLKKLNNINVNLELNRPIFLINMLNDYYEFENKDKNILIFKKNNKEGLIKEEVSIDDLIYFLQIELPKFYPFINHPIVDRGGNGCDIRRGSNCHEVFKRMYYSCFGEIDNIKKIIDNIKYLNEEEMNNRIF